MAAATLTPTIVDASPPGNKITIAGTNLNGSATLLAQGLIAPTDIGLLATFAVDGSSVTVTIPDGAETGTLRINALDGSMPTVTLRIGSQYVQASEYVGEGIDVSTLAAGELDAILRRASSYADTFMGGSKRLTQTRETYRWRASRRLYPRRSPIVSVDAFRYVIANSQYQDFAVDDVIRVSNLGYIEVLTWAIGNYAMTAAIGTLGFDASLIELVYTAGYGQADYPQGMRDAVVMIATEILTYRRVQMDGLGGLSSVRKGEVQYQRRNEPFTIPIPAQDLLRPFVARTLR